MILFYGLLIIDSWTLSFLYNSSFIELIKSSLVIHPNRYSNNSANDARFSKQFCQQSISHKCSFLWLSLRYNSWEDNRHFPIFSARISSTFECGLFHFQYCIGSISQTLFGSIGRWRQTLDLLLSDSSNSHLQ